MKKTTYCLLFTMVIIGLNACKHDDAPPTKIPTATDRLVAHTWQVDQAIVSDGTTAITAYKRGAANDLEDHSNSRLTFRNDGTYQSTTEDGHQVNGTWKFTSNRNRIDFNNGDAVSDVVTLTETNFDTTETYTSSGYTTITTLKMIPV